MLGHKLWLGYLYFVPWGCSIVSLNMARVPDDIVILTNDGAEVDHNDIGNVVDPDDIGIEVDSDEFIILEGAAKESKFESAVQPTLILGGDW